MNLDNLQAGTGMDYLASISPFLHAGPVKLYLDESGTLGYTGEVFTMAIVLVRDLAMLETSLAKNRVTKVESKASQMTPGQKLDLAKKLVEENDIKVLLAALDPRAAALSERKLDKDMLYDAMAGQALAYYLQRGDLTAGVSYRLTMDIRGSLRESYEDLVRQSIGNLLIHRPEPLVKDLDVRFTDSKFSTGVQVADLFSNIFRTSFSPHGDQSARLLSRFADKGVVCSGFIFGLSELAEQMDQLARDMRGYAEIANGMGNDGALALFSRHVVLATAPEPSPADATAQALAQVAEVAGAEVAQEIRAAAQNSEALTMSSLAATDGLPAEDLLDAREDAEETDENRPRRRRGHRGGRGRRKSGQSEASELDEESAATPAASAQDDTGSTDNNAQTDTNSLVTPAPTADNHSNTDASSPATSISATDAHGADATREQNATDQRLAQAAPDAVESKTKVTRTRRHPGDHGQTSSVQNSPAQEAPASAAQTQTAASTEPESTSDTPAAPAKSKSKSTRTTRRSSSAKKTTAKRAANAQANAQEGAAKMTLANARGTDLSSPADANAPAPAAEPAAENAPATKPKRTTRTRTRTKKATSAVPQPAPEMTPETTPTPAPKADSEQ